ncbi:uncharacterized protein [Anser cygnoides]|uniref:uncharacterized protein n=1 Tax=Anser cygnoides TaxID=8845 RepID=UPI0034D3082D
MASGFVPLQAAPCASPEGSHSLVFVPYRITESQNHRITESQNHRIRESKGLEGTSKDHGVQPPCQSRLLRAGCPASRFPSGVRAQIFGSADGSALRRAAGSAPAGAAQPRPSVALGDVRPEDAGTYYCVKFRKTHTGDELYRRGEGTVVSVHKTSPFRSVEVAAAVLFFLLLIFILTFCVYHKKRRADGQSQGAAGAPAGGCSPIRVPCCAGSPGTPSSEVRDAETPRLPHQQSSEQDKDIHYADLQPLPEAPQRSRSPGADRSEYASIRGAAK